MIENYVQLNVVISGAITRGRWPQVSDQIYIVERCVKKGKVLVNYSLHLVRFPLTWKTTKSWKRTLPALMCCPRLMLSNEIHVRPRTLNNGLVRQKKILYDPSMNLNDVLIRMNIAWNRKSPSKWHDCSHLSSWHWCRFTCLTGWFNF